MNCKKAEKLILLEASGELSSKKLTELNKHLSGCKSCRKFQKFTNVAMCPTDMEEPTAKSIQNVLRAARQNAPQQASHRNIPLLVLKPALGLTAVVAIALQLLPSNPEAPLSQPVATSDNMVIVMNDAQFLEPEDQVVNVMYEGLSEDDLAFNFLMTYEGESDS